MKQPLLSSLLALFLLPLILWFSLCDPFLFVPSFSSSSDHKQGARYFNPHASSPGPLKQLLWHLWRRPPQWEQEQELPSFPPPPERVGGGELRVTFINHNTTLIQMDGWNILTDPMWSERASPLSWTGPKRHHPPGIPLDQLPLIDLILVSHNHYASLDLPSLYQLGQQLETRVLCPLDNAALLRQAGSFPIEALDWWEERELFGGLKVTCVPAQHSSGRGWCDHNQSLWGGFVIEGESGRIYFSGDTGYGPHFEEIGKRFGPFRFSLLPIGGYAPNWIKGVDHLSPKEAVLAHKALQSESSLAIGFGCFQLSDEKRGEPPKKLSQSLRHGAVSKEHFWLLQPGEGRLVP